MKQRFLILLWLGLIAILSACSSPSTTGDPSVPQEVTIEGRDITFFPETIEVVANRPVRLTLKNTGALEHEINIDKLPMEEGTIFVGDMMEAEASGDHGMGGHDMTAMEGMVDLHIHTYGGESASAMLTPTEPGTYGIYCAVPGHREAGMVGQLVVQQG